MKCPKCGYENPEKKKFCKECGTKLETTCRNCGSKNPPGSKFCDECGYNLILPSEPTRKELSFDEKLEKIQKYLPKGITEKILSQRDKIEGEKRQVTVMFCDMKGFTRFSEKLLPEEVYAIMDQVYKILMRQVHDFGGTVNEMTGDGILALFGAPVALEEAPQRAIHAGLSIHHEMASLTDRLHKTNNELPPIKMRIGIHTGPVVVGSLGDDLRVEFKAVGDTVVLAARLEQIAEAGQIYVSWDVFRATEGHFYFETLEPTKVKGKAEPVQVYRVIRTKETPERTVGINSPLVGREKQLDLLSLQVHRLINGTGGIVSITGEAGIGKSRLMAELRGTEMMKRVLLLEGRALSIGRSLSFYPIIDALKQWIKIRDEDTDIEAQQKLEKTIRMIHPEEVNEVFPFIATLMGMKLAGKYAERIKGIEGDALEKLIFKNVREIIIKGSALRPTVIYIEDFHWVDTSSLELIEALFRLVEEFRILFILVFRPGHADTGERILKSIGENYPSHWTKIDLEALTEKESRELLSNLLEIKGLPHTLRDQILQRAGGNPFFLEEVVRSLIDEGAVVLKNGDYQVTEKITQIVIPQSIHALIMTRIDKLDEATRNLVRIASVIGRNFFYKILTEIASKIENIDARLTYLQEIQLLRERLRMGEREYLFKHALIQEVVYESILSLKRKELHLTVARSIEKIFDERLHEFFGMLAYHYCQAESLEEAEECLIKAGEEALKSSASNEALHYYKEALGIYQRLQGSNTNPEKVAMLEKNIALALYNRGQYEEAVEHFDKALNHYWGVLPKNIIYRAFRFMSAFFHLIVSLYVPSLKFRRIPTQDIPEHIELYYKKIEALSVIEPKRFFLEYFFLYKEVTNYDLARLELGPKIFVSVSSLFYFSGISFRMSRKILDSAKNRISMNNPKICIWYDVLETMHNYLGGSWKEINNYDDDLVDKNLSIGEIYSASQHLFWHCIPNIYQGCFDIAESIINRLNGIFEVYENEFSIMLKQLLNSSFLMECRKLYDASIEIEEGIKFAQKTNYGLSLIHMFSCKAQVQLLEGDIEGAEKSLNHADEIRRKVHSVPWQLSNFLKTKLTYDLYRFEESMRNGNRKKWLEYQKKALKSGRMLLKQSQKVAQHRTEAFRLMGVYFWLTKSQKKALMWWNRSIREGERLGARLELSRTYFEIGKRLLEPESKFIKLNEISSEEYLKRAKVMFEGLDLQWDLSEWGRVASG